MNIELRDYNSEDIKELTKMWNIIVEGGESFPGDKTLSIEEASDMFKQQTKVICAVCEDEIAGFYILHPNNIGRCSHIANASYGVKEKFRGNGIGEMLVKHSLLKSKECGFNGLQYNAVVSTNTAAINLYKKLQFELIGSIKNGYRLKNDKYTDLFIFFKEL